MWSHLLLGIVSIVVATSIGMMHCLGVDESNNNGAKNMSNAHIERIAGITIIIGRSAAGGWNVSRRFPGQQRSTHKGLTAAVAANLFDSLCENAAEMAA